MATLHQSGSWSTPSILAGYGLSATVGPTEPTSADVRRLNSRSGGKHSGQGNWMQNYRPTPIMKTDRPKKMYDYGLGDLPVVQRRLPGIETRKLGKYKGLKKSTTTVTKFGPGRDGDGATRVGPADINDWLSDVEDGPYERMDTETVVSGRPSTIATSTTQSQASARESIPDRVVQNNNIGPNATAMPPPYVAANERAALGRLWNRANALPEYSPPTDDVVRELNENWGRRMGI